MQISGEIVVSADCAPFENATIYVYLEDVARAGKRQACIRPPDSLGFAHVIRR